MRPNGCFPCDFLLNLIHNCAMLSAGGDSMEILYSNIRKCRKALGLTQQELADSMGYERSSIAKIEKGQVDLPLSKIEEFSEKLAVPLPELLGLDTVREIDTLFDSLSPDRKERLLRLGRELVDAQLVSLSELRMIRYYTVAAAAGYAAPIEGEDYELIPCGEEVPLRADYCINIAGDSMEPYIRDGQRVYVKRDESLSDFDVGIFFVDGDVYCKQWCVDYNGTVHLLSANPEREDASLHIGRDSGRHVVFLGKVLLDRRLPQPAYF